MGNKKDPKVKVDAYRYRQLGKVPKAIECFQSYLRINPRDIVAALDLGELFMLQEQFSEACKVYAKILEFEPKHVIAASNLGGALLRSGRANDAKDLLLYALELDPKNVHARINLGGAYQALGDRKANLDNALQAVGLDPSNALAFNNLGSALTDMAMFKEAKHAYETAVMLDPKQVDALINLAGTEARLGQPARAVEMYEKVLTLLPAQEQMRAEAVKFYAAFEYLKQGKLEKGWEYYDGGFSLLVPLAGARSPRRTFAVPRWDGNPLNGKTLLVWREQGLGDELLFYTCLHELKEMGGNIIVECDKRLVEVMARSFPEFTIRAEIFLPQQEGRSPHSDFDFHLPAGSLMRYFRPTLESFNRSGAYIKPDPVKVAKFQERLAPYKDDYRLVGICWRSGKLDPVRNLSYTTLDEWGEVLQTPGFKFVNLQYGECEAELKQAEQKHGIEILRWPDLNLRNDLDDIFALMNCLDAVASVQTAVLTMAGCAGAPSVGIKSGGWTALGNRRRSLWFENTLFKSNLRPVAEALKTVCQDSVLIKHLGSSEYAPNRRLDSFVWSADEIKHLIASTEIDETLRLELTEDWLDSGSLADKDSQRVVEICLDRRVNRTLARIEKICSIAYKLLLNGFVQEAHSVCYSLTDEQDSLSPASKKNFAVLQITQGNSDAACELIQSAYSENPELKDGYSELASLLLDQGEIDRAVQLYEKDFELNRLATPIHFNNLLRLYAFQYREEKAPKVIDKLLLRKSALRIKDPYFILAKASWQAGGFKIFDRAIWNLDEELLLSSFDTHFKNAWEERIKGDFEGSFHSIKKSSCEPEALLLFPMYEILTGEKTNAEKLLTLPVYSTRANIAASPYHLALARRYQESMQTSKAIYAKDRLATKNRFWWIGKCQAVMETQSQINPSNTDWRHNEPAKFRRRKCDWTVALASHTP